MSAFLFYIQFLFLSVFSWLPLWALYLVSDALYFLLLYVFRYRLYITRDNIYRAFPEKTHEERKKIIRGFYRHLADIMVESLKMFHLSPEQLGKRVQIINPELIDKYRASGKSIVAVGAHYGNWEWTLGIVQHLNIKTIGVYKPLNNKHFDALVNRTRSRFSTEMVNMRDVIRVLLKYRKENIQTFNVFIADQSPVWEETQYWLTFMNQLTAVYLGPEKIARQLDMVVLFGKVKKTSRGNYSVEFIPLCENPRETPEFEITKMIFKVLEESVQEQPEHWLWSHNRWKLTRRREREEERGEVRFSVNNTRI